MTSVVGILLPSKMAILPPARVVVAAVVEDTDWGDSSENPLVVAANMMFPAVVEAAYMYKLKLSPILEIEARVELAGTVTVRAPVEDPLLIERRVQFVIFAAVS